jgi:acetyltransferase-like isoleucine patch superfamily enzyme
MSLYRSIADKLVVRLYRNENESLALRAYFRRHYGIDIGLYSFGAFGRYCSIARNVRFIDANHPLHSLSSHPYFYEPRLGVIADDRLELRPQIVEDDVWIGHNATITPGCHIIGRGAVIGAGAVVTADVPRYAVVMGMPGRVTRMRFDADTIALLEASEWWTLDKSALAAAVAAAPEFAERPSRAAAPAFFAALNKTLR